MTDQYPADAPVYLTAVVANNESVALPAFPGVWATDVGTITPDATNPDLATLTGVNLGDANVTFTTSGDTVIGNSYVAEFVDNTPASVTITGSTTPPADASAPTS
jgi:hypothetical protein